MLAVLVLLQSDTRLKERLLCESSDLTLEKVVDKSSQRNYLSGH